MPELDDFLGTEPEPEATPVAETPEVVAEVPEVETPEPEATPEPEHTEPAEPSDVTGLKSALQAERAKRNDWKSEAARKDGEMAALRAQLEALQKAPPQPAAAPQPPPQPVAIPNPVEDPEGYHRHIQQDIFNRTLNMSESMLRQQVGDDTDVDAKVAVFKKLAADNPALRQQLHNSAHPYRFAYDTGAKHLALEEIGDPASYRSKLEAEIRAQVLAEQAGTAPPPAPRVVLPQSLGTARSAGSRNVPVINVPEAFEDILGVKR